MNRIVLLLLTAAALAVPSAAEARVRLENICTIHGQHDLQLTGLGLVVGLNGTGDSSKAGPMIRALAQVLDLKNNRVVSADDLKAVKNVAVVMISATVPRTGMKRGQRIDCKVSTFVDATSLEGGRLLATPLESVDILDDTAIGITSGNVTIDGTPTAGNVRNGVQLVEEWVTPFIDDGRVTLLLDKTHASFSAASEVARVVNGEFSFEANGRDIASATGPGVIEVRIVDTYIDTPVDFIAQLLDVSLENPHSQARVVVNPRTKVVVVTGEVEISPVVVSHENLTITIGGPAPGIPEPRTGFVPVTNAAGIQAPQRLQDLVEALNALKVPTEDVIEIIRELAASGKLHAEFIEN